MLLTERFFESENSDGESCAMFNATSALGAKGLPGVLRHLLLFHYFFVDRNEESRGNLSVRSV